MRTAKTPAFSSGLAGHRRTVAGGEDQRIGHALQGVAHADEAFASSASPVSRSHGAPPAWVTQTISSASRVSPPRVRRPPPATAIDFGVAMHRDAAFGQHPLEGAAHRRVVGRQDVRVGGKEVKAQFVRVAPQRAQFVAQPVLHRQRQLDAAGAAADHGDARGPGMPAHALEQRQPALVEAVDRLDRHRVLGGAGDVGKSAAWSRC